MRKSAAIFLLTCFGLYHLGFFAVQFLMPMAIHQHWENQIWENDEDFLEGKLIRIPFAMPYGQNLWIVSLASDQGDFEGPPLQKVLLKSFVKDFVLRIHDFSFAPKLSEILIRHSSPFLITIPMGIKDIILLPPQGLQLSWIFFQGNNP